MEIASTSTWRHDRDEKPAVYARMGAGEYFLYAPSGRRLDPPLAGHALRDGRYRRLPDTRLADGRPAGARAVRVPDGGGRTALAHPPDTGRDLPTLEEATAARQAAEVRAEAAQAQAATQAAARREAEVARREAEAHAQEVERELAELRALLKDPRRGPA